MPGEHADWLPLAAGPITVAPCCCFFQATQRLRLSTVGLIQYLTPTLQFLLAVAVYHEPFTRIHFMVFGCIWLALAIYSIDAYSSHRPSGLWLVRRAVAPRRDPRPAKPFHGKIQFRVFWLLFLAMAFSAVGLAIRHLPDSRPETVAAGRAGRRPVPMGEPATASNRPQPVPARSGRAGTLMRARHRIRSDRPTDPGFFRSTTTTQRGNPGTTAGGTEVAAVFARASNKAPTP